MRSPCFHGLHVGTDYSCALPVFGFFDQPIDGVLLLFDLPLQVGALASKFLFFAFCLFPPAPALNSRLCDRFDTGHDLVQFHRQGTTRAVMPEALALLPPVSRFERKMCDECSFLDESDRNRFTFNEDGNPNMVLVFIIVPTFKSTRLAGFEERIDQAEGNVPVKGTDTDREAIAAVGLLASFVLVLSSMQRSGPIRDGVRSYQLRRNDDGKGLFLVGPIRCFHFG